MSVVNMHEAEADLSRLVAQAEAGEEVIIARDGRPVARLVAYAAPHQRRVFGRMRGKIIIEDDFDASLPGNILEAFEGRSGE